MVSDFRTVPILAGGAELAWVWELVGAWSGRRDLSARERGWPSTSPMFAMAERQANEYQETAEQAACSVAIERLALTQPDQHAALLRAFLPAARAGLEGEDTTQDQLLLGQAGQELARLIDELMGD